MHNDFGKHAKEEELDQANGESEARPVVAVLESLETVALEVDVTVKVHLVEGLHGDLVVAAVLEAVRVLLEVEIMLDATAREAGLFVLAGAQGGNDQPPGAEEGEIDDEGKEDGGFEATADLPAHPPWDQSEDRDEDVVVERVGAGAISGEGSVVDGGRLGRG